MQKLHQLKVNFSPLVLTADCASGFNPEKQAQHHQASWGQQERSGPQILSTLCRLLRSFQLPSGCQATSKKKLPSSRSTEPKGSLPCRKGAPLHCQQEELSSRAKFSTQSPMNKPHRICLTRRQPAHRSVFDKEVLLPAGLSATFGGERRED